MFKVLVIVVGALMLLSKQGDAVITNHPISQSVFEGLNVTFNCSTNVTSISTWKKDSTSVPSNSSRLIITSTNQTSVLVIIGLIASDAGNYSCVADDNETSNIAILTVKLIPRFSSHPSNQTKFQGEDANITCDVRGTTPLVVTWEKDGNDFNISSDARFQSSNDGKQLDITQVISSDSGSYVCVASNGVIKRSYPGSLVILANPLITAHPINQTIIEGNNASISCRATGIPVPDIRWQKEGEDLTLPSHVTETTNHGVSTLHLTGVKRTDEGRYVCVANNSKATIHSTPGILTVNYPPVIFENPQYLTKIEGQAMVMWCEVEGKPVPDVTWIKDGAVLVNGGRITINNPSVEGRTNSTLEITNLVRGDEGTYTCTVNNTVNRVVSLPGTGRLNVNSPDIVILNPEANFTGTSGQSVTMVCVVSAYGKSPDIIWYRDGKGRPPTNTRVAGNNVTADLTITNVMTEDSGVYTCRASDKMRSTSTQMSLIVRVPIQVNMTITVENMKFSADLRNKSSPQFKNLSTMFEKEISSIFRNIAEFKEIQVLLFTKGSVGVHFRVIFEIKIDKPSNKPPPDVKQTVTNTAIKEITKTNGIGTIKFKPDSITALVPPPAPRNPSKYGITTKQVSLTWEYPDYYQSYDLTGNEIQYKELVGKEWNKIFIHGKSINSYTINNLNKQTKYTARIVAVNNQGNGPPSVEIEFTTLKETFNVWDEYKWAIIAVGSALFLLLLATIFLCCRKRRNTVNRQTSSRRNHGNFEISGKSFKNYGFEMAQLASRFREIPREQVMIGKELGSGQFGLVVRGYLKQDRIHCAVKMLKAGASHSHYKDLLNELDIMSSIEEHPNIINLIGACTLKGPLYVIVELAEQGCLLDFLHKHQMYSISHQDMVSVLTEAEKIRIGRDVARGLEHLALHRCVHRDLAARNVLLGPNMTAKLSDFGLARDVYERGYYEQLSNMKKLPSRWMSIEAIETLVATKESDIWSFGVLLWEIQTGGKIPFSGLSTKEILKTLKKGTRLNKPVECSDEMYSIMTSCWHSSPRRRPTIDLLATVLDRQLQLIRRNEENVIDSSLA